MFFSAYGYYFINFQERRSFLQEMVKYLDELQLLLEKKNNFVTCIENNLSNSICIKLNMERLFLFQMIELANI